MSEKVYSYLEKLARYLFYILLILNILNWILSLNSDLLIRELPFKVDKEGVITEVSEKIEQEIEGYSLVSVDSLIISDMTQQEAEMRLLSQQSSLDMSRITSEIFNIQNRDELHFRLSQYIRDKDQVSVVLQDSEGNDPLPLTLETGKVLNKSRFLILMFNLLFLFFIFFNTNLILNFSRSHKNYIIVFFFLCMAFPERIGTYYISEFNLFFVMPLLGVFFYHYVIQKLPGFRSALPIYITTFLAGITLFTLKKLADIDLSILLMLWSVFWFLHSFIILIRLNKISDSIEIKRLINAFRGILISLICLVLEVALLVAASIISGGAGVQITNITGIVLVSFIILAGFGFLLGILWFFGSFTWSLLTGTVLDIKIRSTLIYTIVGVLFITMFGLVDYSLGELLQSLFGNFIGSEFIAGIPATIGLLVFFNPIRNKVERIVDTKLNTSDLDFLEKTDSFSERLSDDGVIEGFEEYICENLMQKLPIKKVALISFDQKMQDYKFNETRGTDVIENSLVDDIHGLLHENKIYKSYIVNENQQDISSYSFLIPIIFEEDYKWFLALGRKIDGSVYSKKDESAFIKLTNKIKLSLKFILAYDDIVNNKYVNILKEKNEVIKTYQKENLELRSQLEDGYLDD